MASRSPYAGDSINDATRFEYALSVLSARYASTCAGVGGNPVRSKLKRRMSVTLSACVAGESLFCFRRDNIKASIGLVIHLFFNSGTPGRVGASHAQCSSQFAPSATHCFSNSRCASVSVLPESAGGICSSASALKMRRTSSLFSGALGTTVNASRFLKTLSFESSLKSVALSFSSGP